MLLHADKTAGGIVIPKQAKAEEATFPICTIIAVGPGVADDLKEGQIVAVAKMHFAAGMFNAGGETYALVDHDGVAGDCSEAV